MLTKKNVEQLVRGFLHEACGYLGINDSQIGIIYKPMPVQMMMVALLKESDDIVIDTNLLAKVVKQNTYTILRIDIYIVLQERYICAESIKLKELWKIRKLMKLIFMLLLMH